MWQDFGSRGAAVVTCVRRHQNLQTEPAPAISKMDLPLAKAEPTCDIGSISVTTYLRKGKKHYMTALGEGK